MLVLLASVVLVLPFSLDFDPAARGHRLVDERAALARFLGHLALLYGRSLWLLAAAFAGRLRAARAPAAASCGARRRRSWALSLLAGAGLAGVRARRAARGRRSRRCCAPAAAAERPLWALVAGGLACVLGPELVYVRDEFDGGDLFRMNTVFKLGYQAWLLLGDRRGGARWRGRALAAAARVAGWQASPAVLLLLALAYPVAGTYARRAASRDGPTLDGLALARARAPGDPAAIDWLRANTPGDAVVLEAVGDDYSAFGNARISTFTGRPTVLGWAGPRAAVEPRPRHARERTSSAVHDARTSTPRASCSTATASTTPSSARSSARPTATPALAKWDALGDARRSTATARRSGGCRRLAPQVDPLRHAARRVPRLALGEPAPPVRR